MKNEDKKAVSKMFNIGYTYFESWIESFAYVRNVCAHYGRLYNNRLVKTPKMYKQHSEIANNRIFATLLTLKHVLPNDRHWLGFIQDVEALIDKYPCVNLRLIGFPQDWMDYLK